MMPLSPIASVMPQMTSTDSARRKTLLHQTMGEMLLVAHEGAASLQAADHHHAGEVVERDRHHEQTA